VIGATADTNIYISGFEFGGAPLRFLELARKGAFRLDVSDAITDEILRVLRVKFGYPPERLKEAKVRIGRLAHHVIPTQRLDVIKADPDDNRILECAVAAKSEFIVSGDTRHLLPVGSYEGIRIVTGAAFLELIKQ